MMEGNNLEGAVRQLLQSQAEHIEQVTKLRETIAELQKKRKHETVEEKLKQERIKWNEERTKLQKEKDDLVLQMDHLKLNNLEAKSKLDQELKNTDAIKKHQQGLDKEHHDQILQIRAECQERVTKVETDLLASKQQIEVMKTDFDNKIQELQREVVETKESKNNLEKKITDKNMIKENNNFNESKGEFIKNNPEIISHENKYSEETNGNTASPQLPKTPAKESSIDRVQDYLKNLPPTAELDDTDLLIEDTSFELDNGQTEITTAALKKFKVVIEDEDDNQLDSTITETTDEGNVSMTTMKDDIMSPPGSQASSKVTGISSRNGSRIGSGMFYNMVAESNQITCPFPDEWQRSSIQESIENDDQNGENIENDDELD